VTADDVPRVIGVIHLPPLPGTPFHDPSTFDAGLETVRASVEALVMGGASAALLQTADRVYDLSAGTDPLRVAVLTRLLVKVREATPSWFELGIQVMRNEVEESLAIALATGCSFVRATALIGTTLSPSGWVTANAAAIMRYRDRIGAWDIKLLADIASVHYSSDDDDLAQLAGRAMTAGADAVVVGLPDISRTLAILGSLRRIRADVPVVLAGHATFDNAGDLFPWVDSAFVSTALSRGGFYGQFDASLVRRMVELARRARPAQDQRT